MVSAAMAFDFGGVRASTCLFSAGAGICLLVSQRSDACVDSVHGCDLERYAACVHAALSSVNLLNGYLN